MTDFVDELIKQEFLKKHGLDELLNDENTRNSQDVNCRDFFYLCSEKMNETKNVHELVDHNRFIQIVDKLNCKFPFLKINDFMEDYVKGTWTTNMTEKYNFSKKSDFQFCISKHMLNLPQNREKRINHDKSDYAKRINLKQTRIYEEYNFINKESEFFKEELEKLYDCNLAMSVVILKNLNGKISQDEMMESEIVYDEDGEIFRIEADEKIRKIINENFNEIKIGLYKKNIFLFSDDKYKIKHNFDSIGQNIKEIVYENKEGITFEKLMNELNKKLDFIFSIPSNKLINNILDKLVKIDIFRVETGFKKSDLLDRRYFTRVNFDEQKSIIENKNLAKFYGRPNDPYQFTDDIKYLIKGDFGDADDDQVTRIAGLILAGTQKMIAESKTLMDFDFAVSMEGFVPTEEQIKQMQENDIQIYPDTKIIHIKVAINEEVDSKLITKLKMILLDNEQGIIITYSKIDKKTNEILKKDKDIQIIDRNLLHLWAKTIPTLPARKGSNVKIMEGKHLGGIGKLINLDYTTGKATIDLISYDSNIVEYIRSIEEINLFEDPIQDNFIILHNNYNEFLKMVRNNSNSIEFNKAIINAQTVDEKFFPPNDIWSINKITPFIVESKNTRSIISIKENKFNEIFSCTCDFFKKNNQLCYHLISILNELGIRYDSFNETWGEKSNMLYNIISKISK